jgi:four helix bundle protein
MKDFRSLSVWQQAHELTLAVYEATRPFPREEVYGLTNQLRRGAASIGSNIAEGCGRGSDADFARCLQIGLGSASEVEYQLLLAHDLGFLPESAHRALSKKCTDVKRMLTALIRKLTADR